MPPCLSFKKGDVKYQYTIVNEQTDDINGISFCPMYVKQIENLKKTHQTLTNWTVTRTEYLIKLLKLINGETNINNTHV